MAKAPQTPLSRAARLLDLVPYLNSHQGIGLESLAKEFNVTQTQIIADLTTLWMCGLPGYTPLELMDLSFDSGFVTINNADTLARPRSLTDEECIALILGLDLIVNSLPEDREDLRAQALELIKKLMQRSSVSSQLRAIQSIPGSLRATIQNEIKSKTGLKISYHSSYSDTVSTREVLPIELYENEGSEYLRGICQNAHAIRNFRVDRIQAATQIALAHTDGLNAFDTPSARTTYLLKASSRSRTVMERFSIPKEDFNEEFQTMSYSAEWIRRTVMSCSGDAELMSPEKNRSDIARVAQSLLNLYLGR
jgi:proteasome accessory factor C